MKDKKVDLTPLIEAEEPVVIVVLTRRGLEKSLLFYREDSVEALEAGNLLLARISAQLTLIDNAIRAETPAVSAASSVFAVSQKQAQPTR